MTYLQYVGIFIRVENQPILLKHIVTDILSESSGTDTDIDVVEMARLLKEKCTVSVQQFMSPTGNEFYRGVKSDVPYIQHDPSAKLRVSLGSSNLSLFYMSNSPKWKGISPRNRSVIFTNNENDADSYGDSVYFVFLEGDPVISFGTQGDNYYNFKVGAKSVGLETGQLDVNEIDDTFQYLYKVFVTGNTGNGDKVFFSSNWTAVKFGLLALEKAIREKPDSIKNFVGMSDWRRTALSRVVAQIVSSGGVLKFLDKVYDPSTNGIKAEKLSNVTPAKIAIEYWTTGVAHLVNTAYEGALRNELQKLS